MMKHDMLQYLQRLAAASVALSGVMVALPAGASASEPVAVSQVAAERVAALADAAVTQPADDLRQRPWRQAIWPQSIRGRSLLPRSGAHGTAFDGSFSDLLARVAKS